MRIHPSHRQLQRHPGVDQRSAGLLTRLLLGPEGLVHNLPPGTQKSEVGRFSHRKLKCKSNEALIYKILFSVQCRRSLNVPGALALPPLAESSLRKKSVILSVSGFRNSHFYCISLQPTKFSMFTRRLCGKEEGIKTN